MTLFACENPTDLSNETSVKVLPNQTCTGLFGLPNEQSGVESDRCSLNCACGEGEQAFTQPNVESSVFTYTHANPLPLLSVDPYQQNDQVEPLSEEQVCIIERDDELKRYRVESRALSGASPSQITHLGPCGACSSLQDLFVYASRSDLTEPVRTCGLQGITQGMDANVECLMSLGFSESCAVIWYYNTLHTRTVCLDVCLAQLNDPYLTEAGELNECLACDERESGPIFKRYSGRTRRNSGLASAICRPCNSVARLTHSYLSE